MRWASHTSASPPGRSHRLQSSETATGIDLRGCAGKRHTIGGLVQATSTEVLTRESHAPGFSVPHIKGSTPRGHLVFTVTPRLDDAFADAARTGAGPPRHGNAGMSGPVPPHSTSGWCVLTGASTPSIHSRGTSTANRTVAAVTPIVLRRRTPLIALRQRRAAADTRCTGRSTPPYPRRKAGTARARPALPQATRCCLRLAANATHPVPSRNISVVVGSGTRDTLSR